MGPKTFSRHPDFGSWKSLAFFKETRKSLMTGWWALLFSRKSEGNRIKRSTRLLLSLSYLCSMSYSLCCSGSRSISTTSCTLETVVLWSSPPTPSILLWYRAAWQLAGDVSICVHHPHSMYSNIITGRLTLPTPHSSTHRFHSNNNSSEAGRGASAGKMQHVYRIHG